MKILNLLEAKFVPTSYAYHATKAEHVPSILKHGLVPNHRDGGYGSSDTSSLGIPLTPLSGTYLTYSSKEAKYISRDVDMEGGGIVVICKIQSRTAELDEDRMEKIIDLRNVHSWFVRKLKENDHQPFTEEQIISFATIHADDMLNNEALSQVNQKMKDALHPAVVTHLISFLRYVQQNQIGDGDNVDFSDIKRTQNTLTKKLKNLAHNDINKFHTIKIDKPIGFSGANKIVGLYNPNTQIGWGDIGTFKGEAYHIAKTPQRVLTRK